MMAMRACAARTTTSHTNHLLPPLPLLRRAATPAGCWVRRWQHAEGAPTLFGTAEPPLPTPSVLRCGPLVVEVVPNVGVGSVTYGGTEVCRGINFLFRDDGWGTPPQTLVGAPTQRAQEVCWSSTVGDYLSIDVAVSVVEDGGGSPTLTVNACASCLESATTSRLGFVVLHPLEGVVGEAVRCAPALRQSATDRRLWMVAHVPAAG
jgi:hypothetical protein